MSAYMTETEQLEEIKKWWLRNQRWITTTIFVIVLVVTGYRYWSWHLEKTMEQASIAYQNMMLSSSQNDDKGTQSYANLLVKDYSKTVYASAAHLALAKVFVSQVDYDKAADQLAQVAHNSKMDALKQIATLRLARIYLAQKQYQQALKELETINSSIYSSIYSSVVSELQGDIYVAMGDYSKANNSYASALKAAQSSGVNNLYLEMKNSAVASMLQSKNAGTSESKTV